MKILSRRALVTVIMHVLRIRGTSQAMLVTVMRRVSRIRGPLDKIHGESLSLSLYTFLSSSSAIHDINLFSTAMAGKLAAEI